MNTEYINKLFEDTAFVHTGGSDKELQVANYLKAQCEKLGMTAVLESFPVNMATIQEATLTADGESIPCTGYIDALDGEVEAPFYYLRSKDKYSLSQCKGKIVIGDSHMSYVAYNDMLDNGAVGFITYDGNANYADHDIDLRELRAYVHNGKKIPGVNINVKDAIAMVKKGVQNVKITLRQESWEGESHNVIAELPGECDEWIVLTAHYDSSYLSQGAYDNMSGSVGLLGIAEYFVNHPHRYGLRFVWCGSEERGLLGSKAYCKDHADELSKVVLNINLDMIGCIMGKFIYCATAEEKLCHYIEYMGLEVGFGITGSQGVYSSDSTPLADNGIPAVSFARIAPNNAATIHNSYDTLAVMSAQQMVDDIAFLVEFTKRMACAVICPVARVMPDNMKDALDDYMSRKKSDKK